MLALAGTGVAGWWQLDAWRHEQTDDARQRMNRDPLPLADVLGPDDPLTNEDDGVPVEVEGRYAPASEQFLVSRRSEDGRDGYWVLSPLLVDDTEPPSALLVVRGWTADAGTLPPVVRGDITETGVLKTGEEGSGDLGPGRVIEAVRIPALVNVIGTDLYSGFLIRTGTPGAGLETVKPPVSDPSWSAGLRNLAYALQWWLFGGFAVFLWWRTCSDEPSVASAG